MGRLEEFFGREYFLEGKGSNYGGAYAPYTSEVMLPWFKKITRKFLLTLSPSKVLDLGCARGYLVQALRERGVEAYGVDISDWAISNCGEKVKEYLYQGDIRSLPMFGEDSFDLVVSWDTLEHIPLPSLFLALDEMARISRENIVIEVSVEDLNKGDESHVTVLPPVFWIRQFEKRGFRLTDRKEKNQIDGNTINIMVFERMERRRQEPKKRIILMPCYNVEETLGEVYRYLSSLESGFEKIVFLENNSTDNTLDIIKECPFPNELLKFSFREDAIQEGDSPWKVIAIVRQYLLKKARKLDPDYALFLDSDVVPLDHNLFEKLERWNLDIVGAPYIRHFPDGYHFGTYWRDEEGGFESRCYSTDLLEPVDRTSAGCLLLSRRIIQDKRVNFYPLPDKYSTVGEDFSYCLQAKELGYEVFIDGSVYVKHIIDEYKTKPWRVSENGKGYQPYLFPSGEE